MTFFSISLVLVLSMPIFLHGSIRALALLFKHMRYRIKHIGEENGFSIGQGESPLLVLEYNKSQLLKGQCLLIAFLALFLGSFFSAASGARGDMYRHFFFLTAGQSYILYYWAWKIDSSVAVISLVYLLFKSFYGKVLFFKNGIIRKNYFWSRRFGLNNNVWLVKNANHNAYCLYDSAKEMKISIFSRKLMILDDQKERLLNDFLSKVPEKKKKFIAYGV